MVAASRSRFGLAVLTSLLTNSAGAMVRGTDANAPGALAASVIIAVADFGPLQSIGRPPPAPEIVIAGVDVGSADESKAMVAMMEESAAMEPGVSKPGCESRMRKLRARKASAAEMCAAHAAKVCAAAHAADVHASAAAEVPSAHPAPVPATTATLPAAAPTPAARQRQ